MSFPPRSSPQPRALSPSEAGARPSPPSGRLAPEQAAAEEAAPGRHQVSLFLPTGPRGCRAGSNLVPLSL